ncbi:MAG: hypothetical protein JXR73_15575 [Candidatus Omnitrophica bacterium]|nr:hypothetical protein [Candidatus Omnitrophota bacterium]
MGNDFYNEKTQNIVNVQDLLHRVNGNFDLLNRIVILYNKRSPELVKKIREGIHRKDPYLVRYAAHNLRGMVSNFASVSALQAALLMEQAGEKGDFSQADYLFENLLKELTYLTQALQEIQEKENLPSASSTYSST